MAALKMHSLNMRLSAEDLEALRSKSEALGLTVSEYLRRCGLRRSLPSLKPDRQEYAIASALADLTGELSALVALAAEERSEISARASKIALLLPKLFNPVNP